MSLAGAAKRLDGKVILITGATSGIGAACAARFHAEGATVAAIDLDEALPPIDRGWIADVRDEAAVATAVEEAAAYYGRLDGLVNAAGVSGFGGVTDLEEDEWDRVVDINLKGTYLVSKHVGRVMLEAGSGSIVNLASIEGVIGFPSQAAYNASKGGVVVLTKNMASDFGRHGIRANCLCPGLIETPMTAVLNEADFADLKKRFTDAHLLGRAGHPEEVAAAAFFLLSDDASFITGHALAVDGGFLGGFAGLLGPDNEVG